MSPDFTHLWGEGELSWGEEGGRSGRERRRASSRAGGGPDLTKPSRPGGERGSEWEWECRSTRYVYPRDREENAQARPLSLSWWRLLWQGAINLIN